jgi:hypothetical protein
MKKLKIMLLSFAVLAIVGSALAFKASFGPTSKTFCSTTLVNAGGGLAVCEVSTGVNTYCPNSIFTTTQDKLKGNIGIWCTTTAQDLDGDGSADDCFDANPQVNTTLPCFTDRTIYTN